MGDGLLGLAGILGLGLAWKPPILVIRGVARPRGRGYTQPPGTCRKNRARRKSERQRKKKK